MDLLHMYPSSESSSLSTSNEEFFSSVCGSAPPCCRIVREREQWEKYERQPDMYTLNRTQQQLTHVIFSLTYNFFLCSMQRTSSFMAQHHLWTYCVGRRRNKEVFSHSDLCSSRLSTNILNSIFTIVVIFVCFARARASLLRSQHL